MAAYNEGKVADGLPVLPWIVTREYLVRDDYCDHDCTFPPFRLVGENGKIDKSLVVESHLKVVNKDHGQLSKAMSNKEF